MSSQGAATPPGWSEVHRALSAAAERGPLDPEDLERLAEAAFLLGRDDESDDAWARAHHGWAARDDADRAARAAFWLGLGLLLRGEAARANGWFQRAGRLVAAQPGCAGAGYLLVPSAMAALEAGDVATGAALYEQAADIAARCGDRDLAAVAVLGRGEAAIAGGDVRRGLALLDEAMVAATSGEASPLMTGILYCAVIDACVGVSDLRRAAEWTGALERWCRDQPDMVPYRGQCLVHRAQVLRAHGSWSEALDEAARAGRLLRSPPHPALAEAWYQLGELHRLRGELAEAEDAYRQASELGREPVPGLALLRLAAGRAGAAVAMVRRVLDERHAVDGRLAVLPAVVEVELAAGDVAAARAACDELRARAVEAGVPLVLAAADHAAAAVALAEGDPAASLAAARRACQGWRELDMPYEAARSRVLLALACRARGDVDSADLELDAARGTFARLGAAGDLARLDALRPPAPPPSGGLTEREREVLRLVAQGRTNREVGQVLAISEHTVARHLQNTFTKLGVSSRTAAAAHALGHDLL